MKFKYVLFACAIAVLLYSCNSKHTESSDGKMIFKYNEPAGLTTLDPALVRRFEDFLAVSQLFNGLVTLDEGMNVVPSIAEKWEVSPDGKVYTFYLRKDVKFHRSELFTNEDDRRLTAADVVFSLYRIIDPNVASPGKYIFQNLDRGEVSNYKGIIAVDDYTVKVFLKQSQPSFLYQLSLPYCSIVASEGVEHYGSAFGQHPLGTGPFALKKWKHAVKLVLVKNEDYFEKDTDGNSLPYLDGVAVTFIKDKHVEFVQLKNGRLDMISGLNEEEKDFLIQPNGTLSKELEDEFYLQKTPWLNTDYLGILVDEDINNKAANPLRNKYIRQAIGYAIDTKSLIQHLRNNIGAAATSGFIPKGMPGFDEYAIDGFHYDLNKAKKLLLKAGYSDFADIPLITLAATDEYKAMCYFVQKSLEELGLNVAIEILAPSYFGQSIAQFESDFYRKSWIADFPDAINYFQLFHSKNFYPENGSNYTHFSNQTYDDLYDLAIVEDSTKLRYEYYKQMQQIIKDEAPVIPLFYAETLRFLNKRVTGLKGNSLNMLNLTEVRIAE